MKGSKREKCGKLHASHLSAYSLAKPSKIWNVLYDSKKKVHVNYANNNTDSNTYSYVLVDVPSSKVPSESMIQWMCNLYF